MFWAIFSLYDRPFINFLAMSTEIYTETRKRVGANSTRTTDWALTKCCNLFRG